MSVSSSRTQSIVFTGDVTGTEVTTALINPLSPGQIQIITLQIGFTTITVPILALIYIPSAVTIIPPPSNTNAITLKGVTGDAGIRLHNTDPTTIAIDPSVTSFGLLVATAITTIRFIWS